MTAVELTPTQARLVDIEAGLWAECQRVTPDVTLSVKNRHPLHLSIAFVLGKASELKAAARVIGVDLPLRAPDSRQYLSQFVTTIGHDISEPEDMTEPQHALSRILVRPHECQHVMQHIVGVNAGWWPRITTHSVLYVAGVVAHTEAGEEYVGKVEGDAYAVTETARKFFNGKPRPLAAVMQPLVESYNLLGVGSDMARAVLRSHYATFDAGRVPNVTMAKVVNDYLETHASDLKGRVPC